MGNLSWWIYHGEYVMVDKPDFDIFDLLYYVHTLW